MTKMNCRIAGLAAAAWFASMLVPASAQAQLFTWTKEQMVEYTPQWKGDRFPDGRPKVSDALIERAKGLSMEEISVPGGRGMGGYSQFVGDWNVLQPGKKMVGRVVTLAFMPSRNDVDQVSTAKAKEKGLAELKTPYIVDLLAPGDVLVVDLGGRYEDGSVIGKNLFYFIMKATKNGGVVVDGAIRGMEDVAAMGMPVYIRPAQGNATANLTLAAVNVPIKIGNVTVMPGDLAMGDREGVSFIPPQAVEQILNSADNTHIHDEWTKMKFDEGKYKSSEIYSTPRDQALRQEYNEYLKKRLEEVRAGKK
jgi:regulator of RNase E activity RraA